MKLEDNITSSVKDTGVEERYFAHYQVELPDRLVLVSYEEESPSDREAAERVARAIARAHLPVPDGEEVSAFLRELVLLCQRHNATLFARRDSQREYISLNIGEPATARWLDFKRIAGDGCHLPDGSVRQTRIADGSILPPDDSSA